MNARRLLILALVVTATGGCSTGKPPASSSSSSISLSSSALPAPPSTSATSPTAGLAPSPTTSTRTSVVPTAVTSTQRPAATAWPRTAPRPAAVNRRDPTAVARAFLVLAYAVDTRVDRSPAMGSARAAALAAPALATQLRSAPATRGDAAWGRLVASRGYRSVTVARNTDEGGPTARSSTATTGVWVVTLRDHPGGVYTQLTALVALRRPDGAPWQVVSLTVH